jgi:hypothetical protein
MSEPPSEWRPYGAPGEPPVSPYASDAHFTPYDTRSQQRRTRTRAGALLLGFAGTVVGLGAGGWALMSALGSDEPAASSTTVISDTDIRSESETWTSTGSDVDLFTDQGMAELASAIEAATGSTDVLQAVVFRGNAVVTVPAVDGRGEPRVYRWDGRLTPAGTSIAVNEPFELLTLRGSVLGELCGADPTACTVVAARPLPSDGGAWLKVASPSGAHLTDLQGNPV